MIRRFGVRPISVFLMFVAIICLLLVYVIRERADFIGVTAPVSSTEPGIGPSPSSNKGVEGRDTVSSVADADMLSSYRYERQRARSEQLEWLRSIIESEKASDQIKSEANKELLSLTRKATLETELEGLAMAKGFGEALVFLFDESALVLVNGPPLSQSDAARIGESVSRATGIPLEKVSVSNYTKGESSSRGG